MSELTDAIRAAGPAAVADMLRNDPAWRVFNLLWEDPQEIIPAVERMGLTTLDAVVDWVQRVNAAVGNTAAFETLVDPAVPVTRMGMHIIPWPRLHEAIHATGLLAADCFLHNSDAEYRLPTKAQWDAIAAACPAARRKHSRSDVHDCDDFVRHAMGWLASHGMGNLAHAFGGTRHYRGETLTGGHAIVLVWDSTLTPWQWEPQAGRLFPADYAKLGGNIFATRVEYARIFA